MVNVADGDIVLHQRLKMNLLRSAKDDRSFQFHLKRNIPAQIMLLLAVVAEGRARSTVKNQAIVEGLQTEKITVVQIIAPVQCKAEMPDARVEA